MKIYLFSLFLKSEPSQVNMYIDHLFSAGPSQHWRRMRGLASAEGLASHLLFLMHPFLFLNTPCHLVSFAEETYGGSTLSISILSFLSSLSRDRHHEVCHAS